MRSRDDKTAQAVGYTERSEVGGDNTELYTRQNNTLVYLIYKIYPCPHGAQIPCRMREC